jgi:Nuclease-related domain
VKLSTERSPGQYADERHKRGLRSYRRRMRRPVLVVCAPAIVVATALAIWRDTNAWWWGAGLVTGGLVAVAVWALDEPPAYIGKWGVGAAGERRTAKALRPLLRKGWRVTHDVQRAHENFDHVLVGPPGVILLETKVRSGTVSLEDGMLTIRYPDDPDEVVRLPRLAAQMRGRAAQLKATHRFEDGARRWVTPVVVLWADFSQRCVECDGITYLHGSELVRWLRSLPSANVVMPELAHSR